MKIRTEGANYIMLALFLVICSSFAQSQGGKKRIEWLTLQEASEKMEKEPRILLIDLYTDWCYWCKLMDLKTYRNKNVTQYVNEKFYAVRLNAESRDEIEWNGKKFFYNEQNKVNDFALYLTSGRLAYPTAVILPSKSEAPVVIAGYLRPGEIEPVLNYFGESVYKRQSYQEFETNFKSKW